MGFHQELSNMNYCNSTRVLFYQYIYIYFGTRVLFYQNIYFFGQSVQVHAYIYIYIFFLVDKIKTNIYPYFNMNRVCKRRV